MVDTVYTIASTRPELYSRRPSNGGPDKLTRSLVSSHQRLVGGERKGRRTSVALQKAFGTG